MWVMTAKEYFDMCHMEPTCTCCNKPLRVVYMLEHKISDGTYHDGGVPEEDSQGYFPFGQICAKNILSPGRKK